MRIFLDRLECIVWMSLEYPSVQIDTEHTYVLLYEVWGLTRHLCFLSPLFNYQPTHHSTPWRPLARWWRSYAWVPWWLSWWWPILPMRANSRCIQGLDVAGARQAWALVGAITSPQVTTEVTHGHTQARRVQLTTAKVALVLHTHTSGARVSLGVLHSAGRVSGSSAKLHQRGSRCFKHNLTHIILMDQLIDTV